MLQPAPVEVPDIQYVFVAPATALEVVAKKIAIGKITKVEIIL
jgi:hypothetical protein